MKPSTRLDWAGVVCWSIVMATVIIFLVHLMNLSLRNQEISLKNQADQRVVQEICMRNQEIGLRNQEIGLKNQADQKYLQELALVNHQIIIGNQKAMQQEILESKEARKISRSNHESLSDGSFISRVSRDHETMLKYLSDIKKGIAEILERVPAKKGNS